jgi:UDP-glucose 4-epimerase
MESNVIGTFNLLEAAKHNGVKRFVFASSGAPIGEVEPPIHEELAPHPISPYGASKLAGEAYCSAYNKTFGIQTVILRFGNVFGPRSKHKSSVVAKFIMQALRGETLEIYGDGLQTRDFIHIDDLIQAIVMSAYVSSIGGEIFQIATNKEHTINELVDILIPLLKKAGFKTINIENKEPRLGDVKRNYSDTTKAQTILNWDAWTSFQEGIDATLKWFLEHEKEARS